MDRQPDPAAHAHPVDEGDVGLRRGVDLMVEDVFLVEELTNELRRAVTRVVQDRLPDGPDVAAGAEGALARTP